MITYNNKNYPDFQAKGNAARFIKPFAIEFCKGRGVDVGCGEWPLEGAIPVDLERDDHWHALYLPENLDYIFSSHCLEHIYDWVEVLDYWTQQIKVGGILFLYLPHYSQEYWRPWNNRKHLHVLTAEILLDYMKARGYGELFHTGPDLNNSFAIVGRKL